MCVSLFSIDEQHLWNTCKDSDFCVSHTLRAPIGSSVLLPCTFSTSILDWVSWVHIPQTYLVHLTSKGHVRFVEPRHGRVKAFPNQGSEGNYSICIDELKNSDLGCYRCVHGKKCVQVELTAEIGKNISVWEILSVVKKLDQKACEGTNERTRVSCQMHLFKTTSCLACTVSKELWLICICLCAIAFILLLVSGYCCMKAKCE